MGDLTGSRRSSEDRRDSDQEVEEFKNSLLLRLQQISNVSSRSSLHSVRKMDNQDTSKHKTPDRSIDRGWSWVVLGAGFITFTIVAVFFYTFGIFYPYLLKEFGETRSYTAWVGSLNNANVMVAGPLSTFCISRFGCRVTCILGSILTLLGYICSSFAINIETLFFTHGIISAVGQCLVYSTFIVIIGFYFDTYYPLATAILQSGMGVGILGLGPLLKIMVEILSWRASFRVCAAICLVSTLCGATIRKKGNAREDDETTEGGDELERRNSNLQSLRNSAQNLQLSASASYISYSMLNLAESRTEDGTMKMIRETKNREAFRFLDFMEWMKFLWVKYFRSGTIKSKKGNELTIKNLASDLRFWTMCSGFFLFFVGGISVYHFSLSFAMSRGLGDSYVYAIFVLGVGDLLARCGLAAVFKNEKINFFLFSVATQFIGGVVVLTFLFIWNEWAMYVSFCIFGAMWGITNVLIALLPVKVYGRENLNSVFGYVLLFCGVGTLLGPPTTGQIVDDLGFTAAIIFDGTCMLLCSLLTVVCYVLVSRQKKSEGAVYVVEVQPEQSGLPTLPEHEVLTADQLPSV